VERVYTDRGKPLVAEVPWVKGEIHGVRKTFHPTGEVRSETPYVRGKQHGVAKAYAADGTVTRESTMKNGERDGLLTDYWPETGKPRRVIRYEMGKVQGETKEYYRNGQLKTVIPFREDVMHGEQLVYAEDGTQERSRYWIAGDPVSKTEFELQFNQK
jgi:antitoxin component YwqK of YwqJK toxin-antitoxin module